MKYWQRRKIILIIGRQKQKSRKNLIFSLLRCRPTRVNPCWVLTFLWAWYVGWNEEKKIAIITVQPSCAISARQKCCDCPLWTRNRFLTTFFKLQLEPQTRFIIVHNISNNSQSHSSPALSTATWQCAHAVVKREKKTFQFSRSRDQPPSRAHEIRAKFKEWVSGGIVVVPDYVCISKQPTPDTDSRAVLPSEAHKFYL